MVFPPTSSDTKRYYKYAEGRFGLVPVAITHAVVMGAKRLTHSNDKSSASLGALA